MSLQFSRSRMVSFPLLLSGTTDSPATLVATSAYGHEAIAAHGHTAVLSWLAPTA